MGVLDDAIREHLELKRAHGAAEEEIARKEAEALGPARRGPAPADVEPYDDHAAPADAAPPAPEGTLADAAAALGEAPPAEDEVVDAEPVLAEPVAEPAVPVAETEPVIEGEEVPPEPPEPTIDVPAEVEPPAAIEPPPEAQEPVEAVHEPVHEIDRDPLEPPPPVPGATQEFDTLSARDEDEEVAAAPGSDEDVLEETPEFLRETPEHDRLWFEQKPPRDFDLED
jgi:hypothetical protein